MTIPFDIVCMLALFALLIGGVLGAIVASRKIDADMADTFAFDLPATGVNPVRERPRDLGPKQKEWCRDKWPVWADAAQRVERAQADTEASRRVVV